MSYLTDAMAEVAEDKPVETPASTEPTPAKEEPRQDEPKPEETKDEPKPEEAKPEPDKAPEEPKPEPKPDLSTLTKEQKAEHAFRRQLGKQASKYEQIIEDMKSQFQSQINELKKATAKQEPAKTRNDFATDDEYIAYLAGKQVDDILGKRDAEAKAKADEEAKAKAEQDEIDQRNQEVMQGFQANCKAAFPDEQAYAGFQQRVAKAMRNGIAEILDQAPAVRDYLFSNVNGPAVLNEMLTSKDSFVRVMSQASNPTSAIIEMHDLARELASKAAAPAAQPEPAPAPVMPKIGKPGSRQDAPRSVLGSDQDMINFLRHRH